MERLFGMSMNYDGTIHADVIYTEDQMMKILGISRDQMVEYYKLGLRFYQRTRSQRRQICGAEYHRFVERNSQLWEEDGNAVLA
jgi:hypothetical protein